MKIEKKIQKYNMDEVKVGLMMTDGKAYYLTVKPYICIPDCDQIEWVSIGVFHSLADDNVRNLFAYKSVVDNEGLILNTRQVIFIEKLEVIKKPELLVEKTINSSYWRDIWVSYKKVDTAVQTVLGSKNE